MREQRRRLDAQLEALDRQQGLEEEEYQAQVSEMIGGSGGGTGPEVAALKLSPGHQSEPTTPPEYRDQVFANMYSRRNRYSSLSLMSPPPAGANASNGASGGGSRLSRSGSQLTSPPSEAAQGYQNGSDEDKLPSKSVPGSRRGSTDRFSSYFSQGESSALGRRSFVRCVYMHFVLSTHSLCFLGLHLHLCQDFLLFSI